MGYGFHHFCDFTKKFQIFFDFFLKWLGFECLYTKWFLVILANFASNFAHDFLDL